MIEMTGPDAIDFAQRMFSRDMKQIGVGETRPSVFLSAQGKVLSLFWINRLDAGLFLYVRASAQKALYDLIERYHFAENFKLTIKASIQASWEPKPAANTAGSLWRGTEFSFEPTIAPTKFGSADEWTLHRIRNRIPEEGLDYDTSTLVFDLGFEELCDPAKGCYIGQEVVERVRTRGGKGPRELAAFLWSSMVEAEEVILSDSGEPIGATTASIVWHPEGGFAALGFVKRGSLEKTTNFRAQSSEVTGRLLDKS